MPQSKRPYIAPALHRHGDLRTITQGAGTKISADKASGSITASDRQLKRDIRVISAAVARLRAL